MKKKYVSLKDKQFAGLIKTFRLRSEIETITAFADVLAEEGMAYEISMLTRWHKGERIPQKRKTHLKLLETFAKRGGIRTEEEVHAYLLSVDQDDLNDFERQKILPSIQKPVNHTLPGRKKHFVGRKLIRKNMSWDALKQHNILLYGLPGTGKSVLVRQLLHDMKNSTTDAMFWFQADIDTADGMVDQILRAHDIDPYAYGSFEKRMERLQRIAENRSLIIVFDNVEQRHLTHTFIEEMLTSPVSVILISRQHVGRDHCINQTYHLSSFTPHEYLAYGKKVLGTEYVQQYQDDIGLLGELTGHTPAVARYCFRFLRQAPHALERLIRWARDDLSLSQVLYEKRNLYASLTAVFSWMSEIERQAVATLSYYRDGFSLGCLTEAFEWECVTVKVLVERLCQQAVLEPVEGDRYTVHPLVQMYLKQARRGKGKKVCSRGRYGYLNK